jgi:hypothetical protein
VRVIIAPLKSLGEQLNLPVATIPHVRSELKTWMVHTFSFFQKQC